MDEYANKLDEMVADKRIDKSLKGKHKGKFRKRAGNYGVIYLKENNLLVITIISTNLLAYINLA